MQPDRSGSGAPRRVDVDDNEWRTLSKLLDEALDLPDTERLPWIEHLGDQYDGLKANLRELLANQVLLETADFLGEAVALDNMDAMRREAAKSAGLFSGTVVGAYRLIRELGRGGMGTVWLAERTDGLIKRSIALKLPHPGLYDQHLAERFGRERDILAGLAHPKHSAPL